MLLDLVQGIEWLSGLFVRCTIQKGKEWSANDSSPYQNHMNVGLKKVEYGRKVGVFGAI